MISEHVELRKEDNVRAVPPFAWRGRARHIVLRHINVIWPPQDPSAVTLVQRSNMELPLFEPPWVRTWRLYEAIARAWS